MIEHLKRLGIGLAYIGASGACIMAVMLIWELCMVWPILAPVIMVLLCWAIGTVVRGM